MVDVARVNLYGQPIGSVRWDQKYGIAQFEYDPDFVRLGIEPSPLMMPVREGRVYSFGELDRTTFKGLPGMLADSLPDTYGRALFERAVDTDIRIEVDSLVNVVREALADKSKFNVNIATDKKAAIAEILRLGTSAGGQRAKAIIAYNKATGEIRSGQVEAPDGFDYYIIKLDGVSVTAGFRETENYGRLEYSFSSLVRECGIDMAECSLIEENGRAHFLTKRFDRINGAKVHMQTLCGIAHLDYRLLRAYSYEQAFAVMRGLRLTYKEAQEMFRRMVFNVIVRNQDDHTKNISFLMDRNGKWRLSPAYDMGYAYNPDGQWTSAHQMSINGKFNGITKDDLFECAAKNNIKNAARIIDEVCQAASRWPEIARECEVPQKMIEAILPNMVFF